jgi:hypothetical protein
LRRARIGGVALTLAVLGALAGLGFLPGTGGRYASTLPELATSFRAKEGCTCLFVHGRGEEACREWTRTDPDVASLEIDRARREVRSRALLLWGARARFVGGRAGCRLE